MKKMNNEEPLANSTQKIDQPQKQSPNHPTVSFIKKKSLNSE